MSASVAWPSRGNRGKGSQERRSVERITKGKSMSQVASEAGIYYSGHTHRQHYDKKTDTVVESYIDDRSITKTQYLTLFDRRNSLLRRSNPFEMQHDEFKRITSKNKKTTRPDLDFKTS